MVRNQNEIAIRLEWQDATRNDKFHHGVEYTDQVAVIRNGLPISRLITATYPVEQYEEAYRRFMAGQEGKVILIHQGRL